MDVFSAMLEGEDKRGHFLITMDVAAVDDEQAIEIATTEAHRREMQIVGIEECLCLACNTDETGVVAVMGKAYYEADK